MADDTYNVASTVQAILARRQAEARQAMLDRLNEEAKRSAMNVDQMNAESQRTQANAAANEANTRAYMAQLPLLKTGTTISDAGLRDWAKNRGLYTDDTITSRAPVPSVTTSEDYALPPDLPANTNDITGTPSITQDLIRQEAAKAGIPPALALAVAEQESSFNPKAMGPKLPDGSQAIGTFQLLPSTAKTLGVDPNDPIQNIQGGTYYLRQLMDRYNNDLPSVLRAYGGIQNSTTPYVDQVMQRMNKFSAPQMDKSTESPTTQTLPYTGISTAKHGYIGTDDQQRQEAARLAIDNGDLDHMDALHAALLLQQAGFIKDIPEQAIPSKEVQHFAFTPDGKLVSKTPMHAGDSSSVLPWSPAAYLPTFTQTNIVDKDGNLIVMGNRLGSDGKPQVFKIPVGEVSKVAAPGKGSATANQIIPANIINELTTSSTSKNGKVDISKQIQARNGAMYYVSDAARRGLISPRVASIVSAFKDKLNAASASGGTQPSIQDFSAQLTASGLSPDEAQQATEIAKLFVNQANTSSGGSSLLSGLLIGSK